MSYYDKEAVNKSIEKIKNKETISTDNKDCIPTITDDLGNLLLACPSSYLMIKIEGSNEDFVVKSIEPSGLVSQLILIKNIEEE